MNTRASLEAVFNTHNPVEIANFLNRGHFLFRTKELDESNHEQCIRSCHDLFSGFDLNLYQHVFVLRWANPMPEWIHAAEICPCALPSERHVYTASPATKRLAIEPSALASFFNAGRLLIYVDTVDVAIEQTHETSIEFFGYTFSPRIVDSQLSWQQHPL